MTNQDHSNRLIKTFEAIALQSKVTGIVNAQTELFDVIAKQNQQLALPGNGIHDTQYTSSTQKALPYQSIHNECTTEPRAWKASGTQMKVQQQLPTSQRGCMIGSTCSQAENLFRHHCLVTVCCNTLLTSMLPTILERTSV